MTAITRRSLLAGAAGASIAAVFADAAENLQPTTELTLVAVQARWPIIGKPHPDTDVWCYNGRLPGPEMRVRQGEPVRIAVENRLTQDTTVHWHGRSDDRAARRMNIFRSQQGEMR